MTYNNVIDNIALITLTDHNGIPLYDGWLVEMNKIDKTLMWRDHWKVESLDEETKKEYEKTLLESNPEYNWLRMYTINDTISLWGTSEDEIKELAQSMEIEINTLDLK